MAPGVTKPGSSTKQPAESVDLFPTLAELAGLPLPEVPQPMDGLSLVAVLKNPDARVRDHAFHVYPKAKLGRAIRTERYRLVEWRNFGASVETAQYELYDYEADPLETRNLAGEEPQTVERLKKTLSTYPEPVSRNPESSRKVSAPPPIANRPLTISGAVALSSSDTGIVVAQGGRENGYAVHLRGGRLVFSVRRNGQLTDLSSPDGVPGKFEFEAALTRETMVLSLDGREIAKGQSPGLIPVQPKDGRSVGFDDLSSVGDYRSPNRLAGAKISQLKVVPGTTPADHFPASAFVEKKTNRKPGPVMDPETIREGLESHDRALYIKAGWIRDPYLVLGPDDYYYLTGTQPREGDPREAENPYNIGLGEESIVGDQVRVYRSSNLIEWESLGPVFTVDDTWHAMKKQGDLKKRFIWAPEVHWMGDRWALVHCPKRYSSLALSAGKELAGSWSHPMKGGMDQRHDPSLFTDDDGTIYMLWGNTFVASLSKDLKRYTSDPVRIDPSGNRPGPDGEPIGRIGHEGATMMKVGGKYVHLGTAWSTDEGRKGSYNLYYCVADRITGPYGPRQFAGRFLGHGTPFRDRQGRWWCTAFFNANVPPVPREGIERRDLSEDAQSINEQGVTIVPLDVRMRDDGRVHIRAKDPAYAVPGPDEAQKHFLKE